MPGYKRNGALEDLCLMAVQDNPLNECIEQYIDCTMKIEPELKKLSKRKCAIYLAGQKEYVEYLGFGASKKYWNLESEAYKELRNFISELSKS
jgi:hypothetical protein